MAKQKWVSDIESYIDGIPYGDVSVSVKRVNRKTVQVTAVGNETLRYTDNNEAVRDVIGLLANLLDEGYQGRVQFTVDIRPGQINQVAIKNIKETKY
jgi:Na+-translocating ferredoxin:NAD+ oxidoreductase RnfG subunit